MIPGSEPEWFEDEHPAHTVELDGFWMGKYEVTQRQYEALMGTNPSHFKGPNRPVECVTWDDAAAFCRKLSQLTGKTYTLPTEAQWEYACRAGSAGEYCFGDDAGQLGEYAWYGDNSGDQTHDVGEKKPNDWGLFDMHGNVWEWCADRYDAQYYASSLKSNPKGLASGKYRVFRGGYWNFFALSCRSAIRYFDSDYRYYSFGFRVVRTQE